MAAVDAGGKILNLLKAETPQTDDASVIVTFPGEPDNAKAEFYEFRRTMQEMRLDFEPDEEKI